MACSLLVHAVQNKKIIDIENKIGVLSAVQEKIEEFDELFVKICDGLDKTMESFGEKFKDFDDLAVELNDDIGNLTIENVDVPLDQTFKNPFLGFKCDLCIFQRNQREG